MGQTLSHGVYLPAEGERNCYSGLASNWNLLDAALGDIDGKASATHTHGNITNDGKVGTTANLPLITGTGGAVQAGSFGNQANTFCEGNDSRLSDARTPVAHTHTKSDVTDLLNSNFIPSANNTYDLGSSSYQWNNVYAKGYYYNGVAWGLDKENVWTADNTFSNSIVYFKLSSSGSYNDIRWKDNNGSHYATLRSRVNELILGLQYSSASAWYSGASVNINNNGSVQIKAYDGTEPWTVNFTPIGVYPTSDKVLELGTSTHKWKTLNGINPGALSLPKGGTTENVDYYNIATAIKPSGGTSTNFSGTINYYQPTIDGWLSLVVTNCTDLSVWETTTKYGSITSGASRNRQIMVPVLANHRYEITIQGSAWLSARLMPCQGNV